VSFPETTAYNASISSYWSQQEESLSPSCIFLPTSAQDVSKAVAILTGLSVLGSSNNVGCQFAIRSGGHTPWAGASNINAGVTIDMSGINQVTVSSDQSYTSVGPGNRWIDVYLKLDALGLAVLGGRVSAVGVGGLVTGGACLWQMIFSHII
jgi:FAD binding domain